MGEPPLDDERVALQLGACSVRGLGGELVQLRELWRERPTVNVLIRHFGCLFCHQMMHDVTESVPSVLERGGHTVVIGNGSVEQAQAFFTDKGLPREGVFVATDPERVSYRATEMQRGFVRTFVDRRSRAAYARARKQGHRITGWFGDLTQLGGVLVVHPPARLAYLHRSRHAGDHPNMRDVLNAVGWKRG